MHEDQAGAKHMLGKRKKRELEYNSYPWMKMLVGNKIGSDPNHSPHNHIDDPMDAEKPASLEATDATPIQTNTKDSLIQDGKGDVRVENEITHDTCHVCSTAFQSELLLSCTGCANRFHRQCLNLPLQTRPEGDWFCSECLHYDTDVSSAVDIEGLDDFVIEQRRHSIAEEVCARKTRTEGSEVWDTSVCVVRKDPT